MQIKLPRKSTTKLATIVVTLVVSSAAMATTNVTTTDSANAAVTPTATTTMKVLTIETGYIKSAGNPFTTTAKCPPNFNPFIKLSSGQIPEDSSPNYLASYSSVCVTGVTTNTNNYTVAIYTYRNYQGYSNDSHPGKYLSDNAYVYGTLNHYQMPDTASIGVLSENYTGSTSMLSYVLYCYPLTVPTPSNANSCS